MRVRRGFVGEERWRKAGIAGESPKSPKSPESFERERGRGDNEEERRRVFISVDSDGHGFVGIPSVYLKYTKCRFAKIFKRFGSPGLIEIPTERVRQSFPTDTFRRYIPTEFRRLSV